MEDFQSITGQGVKGRIEGKEVVIGTQLFLNENKIAVIQKDDNIFYHYEWNGQERQKGNA